MPIHSEFDRACTEPPIFGELRYMSGASTGRKFNSKKYIQQMYALPNPTGQTLKLSS